MGFDTRVIKVKVDKIEDGYIHYSELDNNNNVMIQDFMTAEQFAKACNGNTIKFRVVGIQSKKQVLSILEKCNVTVTSWEYNRSLHDYSGSVDTHYTYDNGYGFKKSNIGVNGCDLSSMLQNCLVNAYIYNAD